ncbi:MAG: exosortase E/protease, VPEID-CTERM system [Elusimicrobia bacterium]|nr:exosortase E/protease, VPEID-CTERM system [Elusimicrobiota bacterium]
MTRKPLRELVDIPCLCACAAVYAAEALFFAVTRVPEARDARFFYWIIGSNGKESAAAVIVSLVLMASLVRQPVAFERFSAIFSRGGRRLRCAGLLAVQIAAFAVLQSLFASLRPEIWRGMVEGPTTEWTAHRVLWQLTVDGVALLSALGVCGAVKGGSMRTVSAPIVLILGWLGAGLVSISESFVMPFTRSATLAAVSRILPLLFDRVIYDPATRLVGSESFAAYLGAQCSGIESLSLMFTCCCLYWVAFRRSLRFPRAFVILPIGMAVMWSANVLRIVGLLWIGSMVSEDLATHVLHSSAGWILFDSMAAGLMVLCAHSPSLGGEVLGDSLTDRAPGRYLLPLLAAMSLNFIFPHQRVVDPWFGARSALIGATLWLCFRGRFHELLQRPSWQAVTIGLAAFAACIGGLGPDTVMRDKSISNALAGMPPLGRISWLVVRAAGSIVIVPLVEELAFRGYLARWLVQSDFEALPMRRYTALSFLVSSLAFGFLHSHWLAATLAGMLFAAAAMQRGKLSDAVASHMVANAILAAFALATGRWSVWLN